MHWEERTITRDKGQGKVNLAQAVVHHSAEHLREPVIDAGEQSHQAARKEHVMQVGDDEIGVVNGDINRRGRHEDAAQPADHEQRHERQSEQHRRGVLDVTSPDGAEPVEDFDGRRQGDHDGGDHEPGAQPRIHTALEHMMAPDDEAQPGDPRQGEVHGLVAE